MKTGRPWLRTFDSIERARSGKAGTAQTASPPYQTCERANRPTWNRIKARGFAPFRICTSGFAPPGFDLNDRLRRLSASLAAIQAARETLDRSLYSLRARGGRQRPAQP